MAKISIIMPVYNAEAFVRRMLDSIKAQTLTDFEVLMIDDGSTDGSGAILDEYAVTDTRFKVVHKQNGGVGAARQTGLELVNGEYVIHADSDDWVEPTMLEELYAKIKEDDSDLVICDYYTNADERQEYVIQRPSSSDGVQVVKDLFHQLHGSCCNKLVKRACYSKFSASFFSGIDYCEDLFFWYQILMHPGVKVTYLNKAFYHYYCPLSHNSIVGSFSKTTINIGQLLIDKMEDVLPDGKLKDMAISNFKIRQKYSAFEHPIFSASEYCSIYPECKSYALQMQTSYLNRILFWLSCHNALYGLAVWLYQIKNQIRNNKIR